MIPIIFKLQSQHNRGILITYIDRYGSNSRNINDTMGDNKPFIYLYVLCFRLKIIECMRNKEFKNN